MAGNITTAYQWAIQKCNEDNIGYSQSYRNEQTVSGITYYDCSSFIWYALLYAGFDVVSAHGGDTWPFTTDDMGSVLTALGFFTVPISEPWKKGDIVWRDGHTEMVYNGYVTMGAHSSSYELDRQVSINSYESSPTDWALIYRYGDGAGGIGQSFSWIYGGESEYFGSGTSYNDDSRKMNNACCVYQFFYYKGWTLQAIAALCANMTQESTLNPCLIEIGGTGHGLVQWTPPENLYDVLDVLYGSHADWHNGDKQCNCIYAEYQQATGEKDWGIEKQWYSTTEYPMSWGEWASSTDDPGLLALAFVANYERPATGHPERAEIARQWFSYLSTIDITGGNKNKKKHKYKFILFKRRWLKR